jgi:tight adherence protein B
MTSRILVVALFGATVVLGVALVLLRRRPRTRLARLSRHRAAPRRRWSGAMRRVRRFVLGRPRLAVVLTGLTIAGLGWLLAGPVAAAVGGLYAMVAVRGWQLRAARRAVERACAAMLVAVDAAASDLRAGLVPDLAPIGRAGAGPRTTVAGAGVGAGAAVQGVAGMAARGFGTGTVVDGFGSRGSVGGFGSGPGAGGFGPGVGVGSGMGVDGVRSLAGADGVAPGAAVDGARSWAGADRVWSAVRVDRARPGVASGADAAAEAAISGAEAAVDVAVSGALARLEAAYRISEALGTPLADLLDRVEADLRAAERLRLNVRAQTAGAQATSVLLAGLPVVGLVLGVTMGFDPFHQLLRTPVGGVCAIAAALLQCGGLVWTTRLVRGATAGVR